MITVGVDEVGRGCWAGPLVAGAAILKEPIAGIADSKVLTKARRELLSAEIYEKAIIGLGWVTPSEVDELGLTQAVRLAMQRAIAEIAVGYDKIIIDGSYNFFADDQRAEAIIKADGFIPCVSAASIVAKVARDAYMRGEAHVLHPEYGFDNHVGYGTKTHIAALESFGVTPLHRTSYKPIQRLLA